MHMDLRPVAQILGLLIAALGVAMLFPMILDLSNGQPNWQAFALAAAVTFVVGIMVALSSGAGRRMGALTVRQAYLLTVGAWTALSAFAGLPLMLGQPGLSFTDAVFEGVSGITATGSSVIVGLDAMPPGVHLWRGTLNWIGGLGIAFVAMIFLPAMRIGGMQFFRVQNFDTGGKVMPRAADIARSLLNVYISLTVIASLTFAALGMPPLDAVTFGASAIATGGFAPSDLSFGKHPGIEYAGTLFMILGALPYLRYVQMVTGAPTALILDAQVRGFLAILLVAVLLVTWWRVVTADTPLEPTFRDALFNLTSIMTGTGFAAGDFAGWGGFAVFVAFVLGLIGGCSGSSSGALSVFRVQVLGRAILRSVQRIGSPNTLVPLRYDGRTVHPDAVQGVMLYVNGYFVSIGLLSVALTLIGVDLESAVFAIWTSIGNVGYGIGPMVARTGTFIDFPDAAKWVMILAMLMGRMGVLALLVVVLPRFWRG